MSGIPARTRSLRKPVAGTNLYERSVIEASADADTHDRLEPKIVERKGNVSATRSPSRLPQPPSSNIPSSSISRPLSHARNTSSSNNSSSIRPPRSTAISRPPLSSDNKAASIRSGGRTLTEPNTSRSIQGVSRPPISSENKTSSVRTGSRTPTESSSSLQRKSSTTSSTSRGHSRNASTSTISSTRPTTRSTHTRATSSVTANTTATILRPPSEQSIATAAPQAQSKPAFSTLQQHFSPAKSIAPKPLTSAFLVPPSPSKLPSNQLISAETLRLQTELLQLHLLHIAAEPTTKAFHLSAKTTLGKRFDDVKRKHEELVCLEAEAQGRINATALMNWAHGGSGWGLDEKVQVLDTVLGGVWNVSEPGGRFSRVVRKFERWISDVEEVLEERKGRGASAVGVEKVRFVVEMEESWRDECENLVRKLDAWRMQLRDLGEVDQGKSSLGAVVRDVGYLVRGILQELTAMRKIEGEVMKGEQKWIREVIDDVGSDDEVGNTPGAVWRQY